MYKAMLLVTVAIPLVASFRPTNDFETLTRREIDNEEALLYELLVRDLYSRHQEDLLNLKHLRRANEKPAPPAKKTTGTDQPAARPKMDMSSITNWKPRGGDQPIPKTVESKAADYNPASFQVPPPQPPKAASPKPLQLQDTKIYSDEVMKERAERYKWEGGRY